MEQLKGFPIITDLNLARTQAHGYYYSPTNKTKLQSAATWLEHKVFSIICLPVNTAAAALGTAGLIASACTLGAFKVALFAASLGNIKPEFSTGVNWLAERSFVSLAQVFINTYEILCDGGELIYQGYKGIEWISVALGLDQVFAKIMNVVSEIADRIAHRFEEAITIANQDEKKLGRPETETLPGLKELDKAVFDLSCFKNPDSRSYRMWFKHKVLSLANLPAHFLLATLGTAGFGLSLTFCAAKVALYTAARIHIPIPTGVVYIGKTTAAAGWITLRNSAEIILDGGFIIYKISDSLKITTALVKASEVVDATFKLVFS